MYELIHYEGKLCGIRRLSDGACIPIDEENHDYQTFLIWNNQQEEPLVLEDIEPPIKPVEKSLEDILAEINALNPGLQTSLFRKIAAKIIQDNPKIVKDDFGIDGEE